MNATKTIVAGLTEAQKEDVQDMTYYGRYHESCFHKRTRNNLIAKSLIVLERDGADSNYKLTPLGIAVRKVLMEDSK